MTWIFLNLRISANMVTFLGLILDGVTILLILEGKWIMAGVLVQLYISWDNSDGEVARYNLKNHRAPTGRNYGEFLDELFGLIGFYFIILFIGFSTSLWAGILASYALLVLNFSSVLSTSLFPKGKMQKKTQDKFSKILGFSVKGQIGFTAEVQRTIISLALFFHTPVFLWIYFVGAVTLLLVKLRVYRNL